MIATTIPTTTWLVPKPSSLLPTTLLQSPLLSLSFWILPFRPLPFLSCCYHCCETWAQTLSFLLLPLFWNLSSNLFFLVATIVLKFELKPFLSCCYHCCETWAQTLSFLLLSLLWNLSSNPFFLVATIVVRLQAQEGGASLRLVEERGEGVSCSSNKVR